MFRVQRARRSDLPRGSAAAPKAGTVHAQPSTRWHAGELRQLTSLAKRAVERFGVKPRGAERFKNFFALGRVSWMCSASCRMDRASRERLLGRGGLAAPCCGRRAPAAWCVNRDSLSTMYVLIVGFPRENSPSVMDGAAKKRR